MHPRTDSILGIPSTGFEASLLASTQDMAAVLVAGIELQSDRVQPSHILLALSRIPAGVTARLLTHAGLPPNEFAVAMLARPERGTAPASLDLKEEHLSPAALAVFRSLKEQAARGTIITERLLLLLTLQELEASVRDWLERHGGIDIAAWVQKLSVPSPVPYQEDEALARTAFTDGAWKSLEIMLREARSLSQETLTTPFLLYALTVSPDGLLPQALHFLQKDPRALQARVFAVLRHAQRRSADETQLARQFMEPALTLTLDRAVDLATRDCSPMIAESHLLASLLQTSGGLASQVFSDLAIEGQRVLRYAADYYQEPSPSVQEEEETTSLSISSARDYLRTRVVGQEAAIERILPYIALHKTAYQRLNRPAAVFLFCGPSGVGKTMMARALARVIYGSEGDVLMFEMGQFNDRISINDFIGAPPGYVGFGEGKLTNGLRDNPRRVLLFDEVEKADHRVFDALLRLLDEGCINDPAGPMRDATKSIIVLTSNQGTAELSQFSRRASAASPEEVSRELRNVLLKFFRPEFLNRVDEVILFQAMGVDELRAIAERRIVDETQRMADTFAIRLVVTPRAKEQLVIDALHLRPDEAARGIHRQIDISVVTPVLMLLSDGGARPSEIIIDHDEESYAIRMGEDRS